MDQFKNPEILSFETDALTQVPILDFNNGKPIPTLKIYQAINQEERKKLYSQRFYGYRPLFIPANKDGKFNVSYRPGRASNEWRVYVDIDLDHPDFQERVCNRIKELKKDDIDLGIDQLTIHNFKARTVYEFKILEFSCDGDKFNLQEPAFGVNYLPTTETYNTFSVRVVVQTEKDAKYLVDNADKIIITCEYFLFKVVTDTNSQYISVSDLVKTQLFKDLKGKAQGKFIQRGDMRKLINSLVSNININRSIERPEIENTAADIILNNFLNRIAAQSDRFSENAKSFYDEKIFNDKDYQPDVETMFKSEHIDDFDNITKANNDGKGLLGKIIGSVSADVTTKIKKEDRHEWTGEKYSPKDLVLLTDVLTAFENNTDVNSEDQYRTKTTSAEKYTITFAHYDYTPKPEEPKPEEPEPPKAEPPPAIIVENQNGINLELIRVEGGTFKMGGRDNEVQESEKPVHEVELDTFYIGKYPVTQAQYRKIMNNNPSHFRGDNLPVETVSWEDALEFCNRLSDLTGKTYRLPTEAEWEYAARGGQKTRDGYKYAGSNNLDTVAWYEQKGGATTKSVGQKNANELGLHDMSGNVWEWCYDWYDAVYYKNSPKKNPKGPDFGSSRVLRGGSWDSSAVHCRVAYRYYITPRYRNYSYGFRLVFVL